MLSLSFVLPIMRSNLPLDRLCNCSVIGASGSEAAFGSVTDWFCTLGATIAVVDGPDVSPAALAGEPTISAFDAGLLASALTPVESARAARGLNSSKTSGVKAISRSRRRRGIANPPLGRAKDPDAGWLKASVVHCQLNSPVG